MMEFIEDALLLWLLHQAEYLEDCKGQKWTNAIDALHWECYQRDLL